MGGSNRALTGRRAELQRLRTWLSGPHRVACIVGAAGVGKTTLARELTAAAASLTWCEVEDADSVGGVAERVAHALGVSVDAADLWATIRSVLALRAAGAHEHCLVLDGFENVADLSNEIFSSLGEPDGVRVLITSRYLPSEPLMLRLELSGLSLGLNGDALALFLERADTVLDVARLGDDDRAAALEIVEMLDGIPLAIELESRRLELLSVHALRDRLAEHDYDHGHDRLETSIHRARDRLGEHERNALATLSLLPGGFSTPLAEAMLEARGAADPLQTLSRLLRSSLLRQVVQRPEVRHVVYTVVRSHLRDTIDDASRRVHRRTLLESVSPWSEACHRGGAEGQRAIPALRAELTNLEALVAGCDAGDAEAALHALIAIGHVRARGGPLLEHASKLAHWLDVAAGRPAPAETLLRARLAHARARRELAIADAANELRQLHHDALAAGYEHIAARAQAQAALALAREDPDEALERCRDALPVVEAAGDLQYVGFTRGFLGLALRERGELDAAVAELDQAARTLASIGDPRGECIAMGFAADAALEHSFPDAAPLRIQSLKTAARTLSEIGEARYAASHWALLAICLGGQGDLPAARRALQSAKDQADSVGDAVAFCFATVIEVILAPTTHEQHELLRAVESRGFGTDAAATVERWIAVARGEDAPEVTRARARRLAQLRRVRSSGGKPLTIGSDFSSVTLPSGTVVDLKRKHLVRRIVAALVGRHRQGGWIATEELISACWPGERFADATSTRNRLHVALNGIRKLGFGGLIERGESGYRLDPRVVVRNTAPPEN
ncbi:MAG: AAA family ATPase [Myxococcota bacterium]